MTIGTLYAAATQSKLDGTLAAKAATFAYAAHAATGQLRKYTGEPYFIHVEAVAQLVADLPSSTDEMIAAAYLHDTIEDTEVTLHDISKNFGMDVAVLVKQLTNVSKPSDGNRETRKALDRAHTALASPEAKTIKLADVIHNAESITMYDPKFAKVYMKEKKLLLEVLKEGDARLWLRANDLIKQWLELEEKDEA